MDLLLICGTVFVLLVFWALFQHNHNHNENHSQHQQPPPGLNETKTEELMSGGLIGLAIGDAVGFVVEGNPPGVVSSLADSLVKWEREMVGGCWSGMGEEGRKKGLGRLPLEFRSGYWRFGQYSDDTQLVREFLLAAVEVLEDKGGRGEGEGEKEEIASCFARRIAALYGDHKMVGCGLATSKALAQLLQDKTYKESGCDEGMAGNSPAVRAVGVGITFGGWERNAVLREVAIEQCIVTHTDLLCKAGSVAMAFAVDYLFQNRKPLDASDFIHQVAKETKKIDKYTGECIQKTLLFVGTKHKREHIVKEIMEMIPKNGKKTLFSNEKMEGVSGHVLPSILWAFFCFLSSPYNFMGVLVECLKGGGDTDSTCALACSLSGSFLGFSSLPPSLVALVGDGGGGGEGELREVCRRLWRVRG